MDKLAHPNGQNESKGPGNLCFAGANTEKLRMLQNSTYFINVCRMVGKFQRDSTLLANIQRDATLWANPRKIAKKSNVFEVRTLTFQEKYHQSGKTVVFLESLSDKVFFRTQEIRNG